MYTDLEKYFIENNIPEHNEFNNLALDYMHRHFKTNYFDNVIQIEYDVYTIALDCSMAAVQDFMTYDRIKSYVKNCGYHYEEKPCFNCLYLQITTNYKNLDLYNSWKNTSINMVSDLIHRYHDYMLKHENQFNNHLKKVMDYYGNLYKADKADLLMTPIYNIVNQDSISDFDDLPF